MTALIPVSRSHAPTFAARIDEQAARIERYLRNVSEVRRLGTANQNDQALALVHSAIDPVFSSLLDDGSTLADDIKAYVEQSSDGLTDQTIATRQVLVTVSAVGMLAGLLAAVFVATVGITRRSTGW